MADLCLPLSADEDAFELHSVAAGAGGRGEADPRPGGEAGPAEGVESRVGNIPG